MRAEKTEQLIKKKITLSSSQSLIIDTDTHKSQVYAECHGKKFDKLRQTQFEDIFMHRFSNFVQTLWIGIFNVTESTLHNLRTVCQPSIEKCYLLK